MLVLHTCVFITILSDSVYLYFVGTVFNFLPDTEDCVIYHGLHICILQRGKFVNKLKNTKIKLFNLQSMRDVQIETRI
jgi:type IV secretory pathway VirB6-like protein